MKKLLLFGLLGLGASGFLFLVAIVGLNLWDAPMSEDVRRVVDTHYHSTSTEQAAYYYLLSWYANGTPNEQHGKELWEKWLALPERQQGEYWTNQFHKTDPWHSEFSGCGREPCFTAYVATHPEVLKLLESEAPKLKAYEGLLHYQRIASPFEERVTRPVDDLMKIHVNLHRLLLIQFAQWAKQKDYADLSRVMLDSNHYFQNLPAHGTVLEMMIAVINLKANAEALSLLKKQDPHFSISRELKESFQLPNAATLINAAMENELRIAASWIPGLNRPPDTELADILFSKDQPYLHALAKLPFMQPNQTLNKYYQLMVESEARECPDSEDDFREIRCLPTFAYVNPSWPGPWLVNPIGRYFDRLLFTNVGGRRKKLEQHLGKLAEFRKQFE